MGFLGENQLSWVPEDSEIEQGSGKKTDNDGVCEALHQQQDQLRKTGYEINDLELDDIGREKNNLIIFPVFNKCIDSYSIYGYNKIITNKQIYLSKIDNFV